MKQRLLPVILAMVTLLFAACSPDKFQRIGRPADFISAGKEVTAMYGNTAIYVDINVGGRNVGSWFGTIGNAVGKSRDRNMNREALNTLLESGIQQYAQNEIASRMPNVLREFDGLSVSDSVQLSLNSEEAKTQKESVPESAEIFAVDSHLAYYATSSKNSVAAAFGAVEGVTTKLEITITYLSPAPERKTVWKDIFICELMPVQESLVDNNGLKAKELLITAVDKLLPWISRELRGEAVESFPRVEVQYRSFLEDEGYLLSEADDFVVIRLVNGITRVMPRDYIREIEYIE